MKIKEYISDRIAKIERTYNVKVLFAIENGSRAWRIESKDSDYDVRFVFARHIDEYIRITKLPEVVEIKDTLMNIDMVGFDIHKFLGLLSNSNPTCIEWLVSDMKWYGYAPVPLVLWVKTSFNPRALFYHYKRLAKDNYRKYIESGTDITQKRYLCIFRGLLNAKYVEHHKKIPSINFEETLNVSDIPQSIHDKLIAIIADKKSGIEATQIERIALLDKYVETFLKESPEIENKPFDTNDTILFDNELKSIIKLVEKAIK